LNVQVENKFIDFIIHKEKINFTYSEAIDDEE